MGCIYPAAVPTIASQLQQVGLAWRDYNEAWGHDPTRESSVCGHPGVEQQDGTQNATATDQYATRHDPFMYFHSIIDDTTLCDTHVVNLDALPQDLTYQAPANYAFITPDLCNDGHDATCANGGPGGLGAGRRLPARVGPADHPLVVLPARRWAVDHHLRRGRDQRRVRPAAARSPVPAAPSPGATGPGRRTDRRRAALPLHPRRHRLSAGPTTTTRCCGASRTCTGSAHIGYAQLPGERSFGSDIFACAPSRAVVATPRPASLRHRDRAGSGSFTPTTACI